MKGHDVPRYGKRIGQAAALVCVLAVLCFFVAQKEGYHMDELLSFELSNAEFNPWIVPTQPVGRLAKFVKEEIRGASLGETLANLADTARDVAENGRDSKIVRYQADVYPEPVWIQAEQFQEYVTVGADDGFNYLSVYFNVKDDNHPPLHFMLLHTMSSLFRGTVVPFLGCFINILAILGCCVCFFYLGTLLEAHGTIPDGYGRMWGVCACLLYGFSVGAIATALLIRMYGLMTFFCVASFTLHMKKWLERGFARKNRALAIVTVCGFWTQYFFLFYCLTLAAVTAGLLIAGKRYRELKRYIRTMVLSAVAGVAVFPFAVQDVLASGRGEEALRNLGQGLSGYGSRLAAFGAMLVKGSFGSLLSGCLVLGCVLLALCLVKFRKRKGTVTEEAQDNPGGLPLALLSALPCLCYFLLAARMSPYLVDRYIMPLFPFAAMGLALTVTKLLGAFRVKKRYLLLPVIALAVINVISYDGEYLYKGYEKQLEVARQYSGLPCICVYDGVGYYENLLEFTQYERTLLLRLGELTERQDTSDLTSLSRMVVLRKEGVEEEAVMEALASYGWKAQRLFSAADSVHGDSLYLCVREE